MPYRYGMPKPVKHPQSAKCHGSEQREKPKTPAAASSVPPAMNRFMRLFLNRIPAIGMETTEMMPSAVNHKATSALEIPSPVDTGTR